MQIIVACDEDNKAVRGLVKYLRSKGHELKLEGALVSKDQQWKWADIAKRVGAKIVKDKDVIGILMCWSGTGVCIAANKVKGIRAALCWDAETATLARKWNDANVLCLSQRITGEKLAVEIVDAFLAGKFDEEGLDQAHKVDSIG